MRRLLCGVHRPFLGSILGGLSAGRSTKTTTPPKVSAASAAAQSAALPTPEAEKLLITKSPAAAADYAKENPIKLEKMPFDSPKLVKWICQKCGHSWTASVIVRAVMKTPCPVCHALENPVLSKVSETLLREFHRSKNDRLVDPMNLSITSRRRYWWKCRKCSHEFEARVRERLKDKACPKCLGSQRGANVASILREWHPTRNGETDLSKVSKDHSASGWWICSTCGHEWKARISLRLKGLEGCENCRSSGQIMGSGTAL